VDRALSRALPHPVLRFLADALSFGNLVCGLASIAFAVAKRFELSLGALLRGAVLDGLDGLAARRFGGTRFGVYADDIADGVNYGLAPGVALAFAIDGAAGTFVGAFFAVFTISRLVYFTLVVDTGGDPRFFPGVPSTIGGLIALSSIIVFEHEALIGLAVGVACAQMVSFKTHYRHLGRALASREMPRRVAAVGFGVLVLGELAFGVRFAAALILLASFVYGLLPSLLGFRAALEALQASRR
jgi:CDP-diacylglycerol--serine O-phosphatidyltransferase